jgi:hypothetical protein
MSILFDIQNCGLTELRGLDLQTGLFTLRHMKATTRNFDAENKVDKVGKGGFSSVYKVTACLMVLS